MLLCSILIKSLPVFCRFLSNCFKACKILLVKSYVARGLPYSRKEKKLKFLHVSMKVLIKKIVRKLYSECRFRNNFQDHSRFSDYVIVGFLISNSLNRVPEMRNIFTESGINIFIKRDQKC